MRIRATNNVAKLTNVMKLVASSKLKSVEDSLNRGRAFGESILSAISLKEEAKPADEEAALNIFVDAPGSKPVKHLAVVITTDRGLCGSVNSSLARMARKELNAAIKAKSDLKMFVLGDKGRAQIARDYLPMVRARAGTAAPLLAGRAAAVAAAAAVPVAAPAGASGSSCGDADGSGGSGGDADGSGGSGHGSRSRHDGGPRGVHAACAGAPSPSHSLPPAPYPTHATPPSSRR